MYIVTIDKQEKNMTFSSDFKTFKDMTIEEKIQDRLIVLAWTYSNFGANGYYEVYVSEINHYYDISAEYYISQRACKGWTEWTTK